MKIKTKTKIHHFPSLPLLLVQLKNGGVYMEFR